jgi:hypothetical protein
MAIAALGLAACGGPDPLQASLAKELGQHTYAEHVSCRDDITPRYNERCVGVALSGRHVWTTFTIHGLDASFTFTGWRGNN